jgi:Ni/Co efflux regulator RcnB
MTKAVVKTLKRIGLLSGAGLIAISASPFARTSAMAAAPAESTNEQIAQTQQQYLTPQQQQEQQKKNQQNKNQQNNQQGGQQPKNWQSQQNGQQQNQQNWQGGQQQKNWQNQQGGQQNWQGGQQQKNWQNQQGGQQQNQQNWQGGQQPKNWQNQQGHRYDWNGYQPGHRPPEWQQYRQNFNPRPYQFNRDAERRYRWQPYMQPRGWYYQRWVFGQVLPLLFWGRDYWLDNYWQFGLMDPPYGYVWVRYGNDALLVDVESGQILSVMYGVFY